MAVLVSDIVDAVRTITIDLIKTRWPDAELIDWVNDAARQIVLLKPDANPSTLSFSCAAGAKQTLPAGTIMLLDVTANDGADKSSITFVSRHVLDSERPSWRNTTQASVINYYMYDEWQRDVFYVYPPAVAATPIEIVTSVEPTKVTALTDPLPLHDVYTPAFINYVIWRAFSKDSDFSGNLELAGTYYNYFAQALAAKTAVEAENAPVRNLPPNISPS